MGNNQTITTVAATSGNTHIEMLFQDEQSTNEA